MKKFSQLVLSLVLLFTCQLASAQTRDEFAQKIQDVAIDDTKGLLIMLDKAIKAYPKDADFYLRRAETKKMMEEPFSEKDTYGFIADYTKAIECEPVSWRYSQRAEARTNMKDYTNALKDANTAVTLAEKAGEKQHIFSCYHTRSNIHAFMKNNQAVIADLKKAIDNCNSGGFKAGMMSSVADYLALDEIADYQGALSYINQAIAEYEKEDNFASSIPVQYYSRGKLKAEKLNQKEQGCADLKKALKLYSPDATALIEMVKDAIKENGCK